LILLVIFAGEELVSQLTDSALWQGWFGGAGAPFTLDMLGIQLGRLAVSLLVIGYRRRDFFLVRGRLDAPIKPVSWLGFPKSDPLFSSAWATTSVCPTVWSASLWRPFWAG
jgi:hypothetical protein